MAGVNRATYTIKAASGRKFKIGGESEVSNTAALQYAQAKLKVSSGVIFAGSTSTGLDLTLAINQPGHTDAADGLNLEIRDAAGLTRNIHIPQASTSYKSTLNDGSADITQADLLDVVTKYNTAVGGSFTLVSGHYTSEG